MRVAFEHPLPQSCFHVLPPNTQISGLNTTLSIAWFKQRFICESADADVNAGLSVMFVAEESDDLTVITERDSREPVQNGTRQFVNVWSHMRHRPSQRFRRLQSECRFHLYRPCQRLNHYITARGIDSGAPRR